MPWNYRFLNVKCGEERVSFIAETYYDSRDESKELPEDFKDEEVIDLNHPTITVSWTHPTRLMGETKEDVIGDLELILQAKEKPEIVLDDSYEQWFTDYHIGYCELQSLRSNKR